jgi:hypothetical protein
MLEIVNIIKEKSNHCLCTDINYRNKSNGWKKTAHIPFLKSSPHGKLFQELRRHKLTTRHANFNRRENQT